MGEIYFNPRTREGCDSKHSQSLVCFYSFITACFTEFCKHPTYTNRIQLQKNLKIRCETPDDFMFARGSHLSKKYFYKASQPLFQRIILMYPERTEGIGAERTAYLLFRIPFSTIKSPLVVQYTILSNKCARSQSGVGIHYITLSSLIDGQGCIQRRNDLLQRYQCGSAFLALNPSDDGLR